MLRALRFNGLRKPRERVHISGAAQGNAFLLGERPDRVSFLLHPCLQPRMLPIPMKPPLCSEMIAPPVSGMISPPV